MHVRATTVQVQSGKMPEVIDIMNQVLLAAKTVKGFQGAYLMTDAASGKALATTVWESEADMLAGESSTGHVPEAITKLGSLLVGSPDIDHYELSVDVSA